MWYIIQHGIAIVIGVGVFALIGVTVKNKQK